MNIVVKKPAKERIMKKDEAERRNKIEIKAAKKKTECGKKNEVEGDNEMYFSQSISIIMWE